MQGLPHEAVGDPTGIRSRIQSVRIGARLTLGAAVATAAYVVATWDSPHRTAILVLVLGGLVFGHLPRALGAERMLRAPHSDALFLGWSASSVVFAAAIAALDGGVGTPLSLLFFLPVAFVALFYPGRSVVAIATLDVAALVTVGIVTSSPQPTLAFFAACLGMVALLCTWEALDHERQRDALARVSRADSLTGALNRRGFEERLEAELDHSRRGGLTSGLVVLDLDDFKQVNDTRGHEAGDALLSWTAARAAEVLRPMDSLGRLGGDEFAVLVPGAGPSETAEVAVRLRDALSQRVSVCTGMACFPIDGDDRESLYRHADRDLYAAKHGRTPELGPTTRELAWAAALARAVELRTAVADPHGAGVAGYAAAIAQGLGWSGGELALLRMAAMLHDVGKVSVPDKILQKPGPLTLDEFELVKSHTSAGAEIVEQVEGLSPVVDWIRYSHEHFDGSGYPEGLSEDDIPMASRILLVAEAFEAMTSRRPYGSRLPAEVAVAELRAHAGIQFDPACVAALEQQLGSVDDELMALAGG